MRRESSENRSSKHDLMTPGGFMVRVRFGFVVLIGLALCAGCDKKPTEGVPLAAQPLASGMPEGHPPIGGNMKPSEGKVVEGTVVETMDVSGYTYLQLETTGGKEWAAVPTATVKVGDKVAVEDAMPMNNFESPSLNRKFEKIYFGVLRGAGAPSPHGASEPAAAASALPVPAEIKVDKATGANAFTVAEVFAKAKELPGKEVRVRGVVVKVNKRIMGRNWVHLRDGSGSEDKKDHDLVITSEELPQVGTTVTMTGKLATDKDFGAGYAYSVLIEEASFAAEGGK
jgi:hypothetical protein